MKFRKKPVVIDATQWFKNGDHNHFTFPITIDEPHWYLDDGFKVDWIERKIIGWECKD